MSAKTPDSDSYRQCKIDTGIILSCIAESARACGYSPKLTLVSKTTKEEPRGTSPESQQPNGTNPGCLKGKACKEAKQLEAKKAAGKKKTIPTNGSYISEPVAKYTVTTTDILLQVDAIVGSKRKIRMSTSVQRAALQAISLHERFAKYFQVDGDAVSNKGHRYFIIVLKRAYKSFEDAGFL
jgi:hypothetical protein